MNSKTCKYCTMLVFPDGSTFHELTCPRNTTPKDNKPTIQQKPKTKKGGSTMKRFLKELLGFVLVMMFASGLAAWAYVGGQSHIEGQVEEHFHRVCGDVPSFHVVGQGINQIYIESYMDDDCNTTPILHLWTIPK